MYTPPAFREEDPAIIHQLMREVRLATFVTSTADGLLATPLPFILAENEGTKGVLHGHLAKANAQWKADPIGEGLVIFTGADAYITPSWYATKQEHGKVVPTWNYAAVHAYGIVEFFEDADRLRDSVTQLTDLYERPRAEPWSVTDAPASFVDAQLNGIVGIRFEITRIEAKRKMSQNRVEADRAGVVAGLRASNRPDDQAVSAMVPISTR